jgi:hypothetical protein
MAEVDPTMIPLPEDQPPQPRDIKLPPFWTTRLGAWFTFAESRFQLRSIEDKQQRFEHVLSALPAEMVSQVMDLVDTLPTENQYQYFKAQLLNIHQLSDYEKFDMLSKMEPMGGRKPSQLLHAMLEYCPVGKKKHLSFHYFFMQRLPQALRKQLGEEQRMVRKSDGSWWPCGNYRRLNLVTDSYPLPNMLESPAAKSSAK